MMPFQRSISASKSARSNRSFLRSLAPTGIVTRFSVPAASISSRVEATERITRAVIEHHPYALCFACLAAEHGIAEFDIREIAQVAVLREGFRVVRRVCYRCNTAYEMLVAPDPTCPS
jgi:hypothetical protein